MKKYISFLFVGVFLIFLVGCGGGGSNKNTSNSTTNQTKQLSGYVVDDPIANATIEIYDTNGTLIAKKENATDEKGRYSIQLEGNYTFPLLLKVTNGEINGAKFDSTMLSLCFDSQCNITPVTSILVTSFAGDISLASKEQLSKFTQEILGIDNWQSTILP
jgi:hypothetical protein